MDPLIDIHEFLFEASEVGEWEGEESLAADNINRIYHALCDKVDAETDPAVLREMMEAVWPYWQHQPGLVQLDDETIEHFVLFLIEEFQQ